MPRPLVFGNGALLVNLDSHFSMRDLYFPYVGWANHVGGHRCRVGVWADSAGFAWLEDGGWERTLGYETDTLVSDCAATHHGLGIRLRFSHAVLHDADIFLTRVRVQNLRDETREVRVFFAHDLRIDESDIGDTAYFDPYAEALIHYKRDRYFLFSGRIGVGSADRDTGIFEYGCGEKGFRGAEGAWRDAEDGHLSGNPIAQGAVDSVESYRADVPGRGEARVKAWMAAGGTRDEVLAMQAALLRRGFEEALSETAGFDGGYALRRTDLDRLPPGASELFTRSVLIIRTQADRRGAILASNDTDIMDTARAHYSYLWPRDGALVSAAMDSVGLSEISRPFFEFCARVLPPDRAALRHKYGPDGTVGASWHPWVTGDGPGGAEVPFQEDGTALVVWAFHKHVQTHGDTEFARRFYAEFVRPAADFLREFRFPSGLPRPSWDLWEERRGTHIFTTAAVIGALEAAAALAAGFGDPASAERWTPAAEETRQALLTHFWDDNVNAFARMVTTGEDGTLTRDMTCDASAYALFAFGALPAADPKVAATMARIGRALWVKTGGGGLARYERDPYFRVSGDFSAVPGNPWIICTLWLADWYIALAQTPDGLRPAADLLAWAVRCALPTGVLPEQADPFTLAPLSVAPLTWSHAQFVSTACAYLDKLACF